MITHTYEEYPEIVKAAGQVLDSACARGEVTRMGGSAGHDQRQSGQGRNDAARHS